MSEPFPAPRPGAAVYLAPAGSEIIGFAANGVPVAADENGAGAMQRLGTFVGFGPVPDG